MWRWIFFTIYLVFHNRFVCGTVDGCGFRVRRSKFYNFIARDSIFPYFHKMITPIFFPLERKIKFTTSTLPRVLHLSQFLYNEHGNSFSMRAIIGWVCVFYRRHKGKCGGIGVLDFEARRWRWPRKRATIWIYTARRRTHTSSDWIIRYVVTWREFFFSRTLIIVESSSNHSWMYFHRECIEVARIVLLSVICKNCIVYVDYLSANCVYCFQMKSLLIWSEA